MSQRTKLGVVGVLIILVSQNILASYGAILHDNGGYEIVIGIKEDAKSPSDTKSYVEIMKNSFQTLSNKMWESTDEKFHIKSVKVVLPATWKYEEAATTINVFQSADIRISQDKSPQADNPNLCGVPGNFIELPTNFFETANNGPYGPTWKALLNVWARYRWGVWEEHGYPGDKRFPYFYRPNNAASAPWEVTGCSSVPLNGTYLNAANEICDVNQDGELDVTCRFVPDRSNNKNAKSSIMHFHWIESVERFCDKASHKTDVPNKQNLFCDYKSVMEIIQTSTDSKVVTIQEGFVPVLEFNVHKASASRPLYVLLDRGTIDDSDSGIVNVAYPEIGKLFSDTMTPPLPKDTIVALGAFPTSEANPNLEDIISFTLLEGKESAFLDAIGDGQKPTAAARDFGLALQQAADAITKINPNGGNILVLKTGGASQSPSFTHEKELELELVGKNITVYAIEVSGVNHARYNLENLASVTSGISKAINTQLTAQADAADLVKSVASAYSVRQHETFATTPRITWRGEVTTGQVYTIPVLVKTESLAFYFITSQNFNSSDIRGGLDTQDGTYLATFANSSEYSSTENSLNRFVYTGILDLTFMSLHEATFKVNSSSAGTGYLLVTATGAEVPADITVVITTSAVQDAVDLESVTNANAPFAIFARVQQNGIAVAGASVEATMALVDGSASELVTLYDNGAGTEDVAAHDGIYSGVVVPPVDGLFSVSVTVTKAETTRSVILQLPASSNQRLIPVDQKFPVGPEAVEIPEALYKTAAYEGQIEVKNRAQYKNVIAKVRDLSAAPGEGNEVIFAHTVPKILGQRGSPKLYRYFIAPTSQLLTDLDPSLSAPLPAGVEQFRNHTDLLIQPGNTLTINHNITKRGLYYYVVVSSYDNDVSQVSNIAELRTDADPIVSTTTEESGSTEEEDEDSKPWIKKTAGIVTIVVIVLVIFIAAGAGYWYMKKRRSTKTGTTFSNSP